MKQGIVALVVLVQAAAIISAENRQIIGSGPVITLPGRNIPEKRVTNADVARSRPGDYFWRKLKPDNNGKVVYTDPKTGETWGWLTIVQGDITWARKNNFMGDFKPALPDIDDSGEKYMEYKKNDAYSRRLYDNGTVEDVITKNAEFDSALAAFKKRYPNPIPRRNDAITGATNWYYVDTVDDDFPEIFWASITLEGRVMRVIIANGLGYRLSVSYWADDSFFKDYPGASWSWEGVDKGPSQNAKKIEEDPSQNFWYYDYSN